MISIGIDLGLSGAIACLFGEKHILEDLPIRPDGEGKRIDGGELRRTLLRLCPAGEIALVAFEDVRVRPSRAFASETSLLRSRGIVEGAIDCTPFDAKAIQPQSWKRHFGLLQGRGEKLTGKQKEDASLEMARRLFPLAAGQLARQKDHNRAEALLIALYARDKFA